MKIRRCVACNVYTLKQVCGRCGSATVVAKPARFSPEDPYGKYRRMMKKGILDDTHQKSSP